jgi:LacI family transcriptional regulator
MEMPLSPPRQRPHGNVSRVAISEVARRAGVSIATVSRVVNGITNKTSPSTIARVKAAIEELGYRPSQAGSALRSGRSRLIALLIPDTTNAYNGAVAASVETAMRGGGHVMIVCNTGEDPDLQDDYLLEMRSHLVSGLVLFTAVPSPVLKRFVQEGEPVVFVNRRSPVGIEAPFVGIDDHRAGREVAEHFLHRGYRPIGILHGPLYSSATADRFHGFREGLAEKGVLVADEHVRGLDTSELSECYRVASELLAVRPRPRAIFCTNDMRAFGAYRRCLELGLSVPDDVALFGFDDNPLNEYIAPWLNTVRLPYALVGAAVRSCFEQIWSAGSSEPPPQIILPYELVLRDGSSRRRRAQ